MSADGLRVPVPVAALCQRTGPAYRGALITRRIAPARALADRLDDPGLDWREVGRQLRGFHNAGVRHADLNARNILLHDQDQQLWLLDFDRSRYRPGKPVDGQRNLARLRRSLLKFWPGQPAELETSWKSLVRGYRG